MTKLFRWMLLGFSSGPLCAAMALAEEPAVQQVTINISEPELSNALIQFTQQTGLQLVFPAAEGVKERPAPRLAGTYPTRVAIEKLLKDSGFGYEFISPRTVVIRKDASAAGKAVAEGGGSGGVGLRLVDGEAPQPSAVPTGESGSQKQEDKISEIIVTAQKKSERLQDVPIPISVISADALTDANQVLLKDYYSQVPGLFTQPSAYGEQPIYIRGIGIGAGAPTVGITIDDAPFGGSSDWTGGGTWPDLDPGDLDHIEVLRGPQGTLYGADAMGGLIRFVTKDPSTDGFSGRAEVGASGVTNGAEPGYVMRASGNIPLSNNLAVRVSAYTRQDPGYIDNPISNQKGVNETEAYGGRLSLLWKPTADLSLKLSAIYQRSEMDGSPAVVTGEGLTGLQNNFLPGLLGNGVKGDVQDYTAVIKDKIGPLNVTSVTDFNEYQQIPGIDWTLYTGSAAMAQFGVTGSGLIFNVPQKVFSQELRFSGSLGDRLDWLVAGFYKHDDDNLTGTITANDPLTGRSVGVLENAIYGDRQAEEYAGFADLTYHASDRLQITVGGRETHEHLSIAQQIYTGRIIGSTPSVSPANSEKSDSFTYSVSPEFKLSEQVMVYARVASGFRPGGFNNLVPGAPPSYAPDKTQNYEVGLKGDFFSGKLSVDTSLFHTDWTDIQTTVCVPDSAITTYTPCYGINPGDAKSEGVEVSLEARPINGFTLSGWIDYDNAVLTKSFPTTASVVGVNGDRLPQSARITAHAAIDYNFTIAGSLRGFVGAAVDYQGNKLGYFQSAGNRVYYPPYTKTDLRLGARYELWTVTIYANNVGDVRGIINKGEATIDPNEIFYITPRTIGLTITRSF